MNTLRLRQHCQPWAFALVLALLLLTGWGQVHRVLHPGAALPALGATADAQLHKAALGGHDEGSSLCQLLDDHLSQGSTPVAALISMGCMPLAQVHAAWPRHSRQGFVLAPFEARGPPHFA